MGQFADPHLKDDAVRIAISLGVDVKDISYATDSYGNHNWVVMVRKDVESLQTCNLLPELLISDVWIHKGKTFVNFSRQEQLVQYKKSILKSWGVCQ